MITTRYHGPTNHRGARVSARTHGPRKVTLAWDYSLNADQNHDRAAETLARRIAVDGPAGAWYRWSAPDHTPDEFVYVRACPRPPAFTTKRSK